MKLLIIFLIINFCLNQDIIDIRSFENYRISKNISEIIFKYEYNSIEKTDIIIYISPYTDEKILGEMIISTDIDSIKRKDMNKDTIKRFQLNYDIKKAIAINSNDPANIGENVYYLFLSGKISCDLEIFLSNEIRTLYVNQSYYFPPISNMTSKYLTFEIQEMLYLQKNYFLNILKKNKSCDSLELYRRNEKMSCNGEIKEYTELIYYSEYSIKIFYENDENNGDLAINFMEHVVQNLAGYTNNLLFIDGSEFYFFINFDFFSSLGINLDYDSSCETEIYYLPYISSEDSIPETEKFTNYDYIKYDYQNSFMINYYNESLRYALLKIKINKYKNSPLKIYFYTNNIFYIKEIPFNYHLEKENNYFFIIDSELKYNYADIENYFLLKYNVYNDNIKNHYMKIYTSNNNKIFRVNIDYEKINDLITICFDNTIEGDFQIIPLPLKFNKKIINNKNNLNYEENYMVFSEDKNELTEIVNINSETIFYFNLNQGDISVYLINNSDYSFNDLDEIPEKDKKIIKGIEIINSGIVILKYKIYSYSIFENFIQKNDNLDIILFEPKIKYFRENLLYQVNLLLIKDQMMLKLLTPEKKVTVYDNYTNLSLDSKNLILFLNQSGNYYIKGQKSIVAFYMKLTNNNNYSLCNKESETFENIQEIFIIPNKTNFDSINIFITYFDEQELECDLIYLVDFNIIPFTRKKLESFKRLSLKSNEKNSLIIKNFYKDNKGQNLDIEKLFIYLSFNKIMPKLRIEIKYMNNYNFLNLNEPIILQPGFNKIFLGYEYNYFLKVDLCENDKINYIFIKNELIDSSSEYINLTSNEILSLENKNIDDHYSIYINNDKDILLSFTNDEIKNTSDINYNTLIDMKNIDSENREIIFEFDLTSCYPEAEYTIFIFDSNYSSNLNNSCKIFNLINQKLFKYKEIIISNNEELGFNLNIKLGNILEKGKDYILFIMVKEILNSFPNYKFYEPYKFNFNNEDSGDTDDDHDNNQKDENKNGISTLALVIIISSIIFILIIGFAIFFKIKRKGNKNKGIFNIQVETSSLLMEKED